MGERLRRRVRPFVLRRLKSEVAPDLPARTEDVLWVELEENERSITVMLAVCVEVVWEEEEKCEVSRTRGPPGAQTPRNAEGRCVCVT